MLVEGEKTPLYDLDSCRGHLLVGFAYWTFAYRGDLFQLGRGFDMDHIDNIKWKLCEPVGNCM